MNILRREKEADVYDTNHIAISERIRRKDRGAVVALTKNLVSQR